MAKPAPGHPPDTDTSREERTQPGGGGGGIPHHRPGAGPPLLPGPLAPPRVALRRGRRPPSRRGCAPGPGLAPRRSRRLGEGVWTDTPAAAPAQQGPRNESDPGWGGAGRGVYRGRGKARGRCWGIRLPEVPPRPPPTPV